jgi:urease gamma subunit
MALIKEKISKGMRINVNEVLLMYLDYSIQAFHSGKKVCDIINEASNILALDQVMIGVPESLAEIKFALVANNIPKQLFVLLKPIITTPSALALQQ